MRPVVARAAVLTVDARGVVAAADADSPPSALARGVQAERQVGHRLVEVAVVGLAVAVALWTGDTQYDEGLRPRWTTGWPAALRAFPGEPSGFMGCYL